MWTLTYAGTPRTIDIVMNDMGNFRRRLQYGIGRHPWAWVAEDHPEGHGLHVHFAVAGYIPGSLIERAWGRGFVHPPTGGLVETLGTIEASRAVAGYLSKRPAAPSGGGHRYHRARGFPTQRTVLHLPSQDEAIATGYAAFGGAPDWDTWAGRAGAVPTWVGRWSHAADLPRDPSIAPLEG